MKTRINPLSEMDFFSRKQETLFEGPGGRVELLPEGIVYLRIDTDGEVGSELQREILLCIHALSPEQRPVLLIDRTHSYWLSFEAQHALRRETDLAAVAYWIRRSISGNMADYADKTYFGSVPVKVFRDREPAVEWLASFLPTGPKSDPEIPI